MDVSGKDLARQSKALYAAAEKAKYATVWAGQDSRMLCLSAASDWNEPMQDRKLKVCKLTCAPGLSRYMCGVAHHAEVDRAVGRFFDARRHS